MNQKTKSSKHGIIIVIALVAVVSIVLPTVMMLIKNKGNIIGHDENDKITDSANAIKDEYPVIPDAQSINTGNLSISSVAKGNYFYFKKDEKWQGEYIKGVNMGLTLGDTNLDDPDISYDTYMEWFKQINDMGANTVRVFTPMNPDFYNALYDYNSQGNSMYFMQGLWFNENYMYDIGDAYGEDGKIISAFKKGAKEIVDIVHGKSDYTSYGTIDKAIYDKDVSQYLVGYILGLEWTPDFVENTNSNNKKQDYNGTHLKTTDASPFEVFLAKVGDELITYDTEQYNFQAPVAFLNWQTTDTLEHSNEPFDEEDQVSVDTGKIKAKPTYYAGLFAAVDVYPYYPEFMNHQSEYIDFKDESGKSNPYRAYLKDLKKTYSIPVIIAEFGVPTSRGMAHESAMGYNQGALTEEQQGNYIVSMMKDIAKSDYAGGLVFSWQDEWFKGTWNTIKYSPENPNDRGVNPMSAEQFYGILGCYPGNEKSVVTIDGNVSEWDNSDIVTESSDMTLSMKADVGYLYLYVKSSQKDFSKDKVYIPVSFTGRGSESYNDEGLHFNMPTDFVVAVNGENQSRVLVDSFYDCFTYQYCYTKKVFPVNTVSKADSGVFNKINTFISNEMVLPVTGETIAPKYYESGLLTSYDQSKNNSNLADVKINGNIVELRIPWYLLNVMNITEQKCIGNFYENRITFEQMGNFSVGIGEKDSQISLQTVDINAHLTKGFHTKLKDSYTIIRSEFPKIMAK